MADIHHIRAHRVVHVPVRTLDDIARENEGRPNLYECINRPSALQRIGDALGSERMLPIYAAFISGSLFTMAMAIFWARVL